MEDASPEDRGQDHGSDASVSWAASRASAICLAMGRASSTEVGAWAAIRRRRSLDEFEDQRLRTLGFLQPVDVSDGHCQLNESGPA